MRFLNNRVSKLISILVLLLIGLFAQFSFLKISSSVAHQQNIKERIAAGEAAEMQLAFPEGAFFTHMLYGTAWVNLGLLSEDPEFRKVAATEASLALESIEQPEVVKQFAQPTQLERGIFYTGWANRLRGGILLLTQGSASGTLVETFHAESERIAVAFEQTSVPFLASYPDQSWPVDSLAALASLRMHDRLYGSNYQDRIVGPWKQKVVSQYGDSLLPHQVDSTTGAMQKPARGASSSLLLSLLPEVDPELSGLQFIKYQQQFVDNVYFFDLTREYPKGHARSQNTNSGPIIFDYGAVASVVHIAAANANGNLQQSNSTRQLFDFVGIPIGNSQTKHYLLSKFLLFDVFLTWSGTHFPWI